MISDGTPGLLASPYYPKDIPNDMECSWNITGPSDSRLVLLFRFLCLGICTSPASQCSCDSLSISNVFGARQICPQTELIPFISIGNRISLSMVTDEQYNSKGFLGKHESVSRLGGLLTVSTLSSYHSRSSHVRGLHLRWYETHQFAVF